MNALLELIYLGNFISYVLLFTFTWLILSTLPRNKIKNQILLSIPLAFIIYIIILALPLPPPLQKSLKQMLIQQSYNKVESNGLLNSILLPCIDNKGFIRGNDYRRAIEGYNNDLSNFKTVFSPLNQNSFSIDPNLKLCDFTLKFNEIKHERY